jgi:hypothetical protein
MKTKKVEAYEALRSYAAPAVGIADRETLAQVFEDICEALGVTSNEYALVKIERLKDAAPPAASADAVRCLQEIARTTFSGSEMGDEYIRGNQDAHATCARMARAALSAPVADAGMRERAAVLAYAECVKHCAARDGMTMIGAVVGHSVSEAIRRLPLSPDATRPNAGVETSSQGILDNSTA